MTILLVREQYYCTRVRRTLCILSYSSTLGVSISTNTRSTSYAYQLVVSMHTSYYVLQFVVVTPAGTLARVRMHTAAEDTGGASPEASCDVQTKCQEEFLLVLQLVREQHAISNVTRWTFSWYAFPTSRVLLATLVVCILYESSMHTTTSQSSTTQCVSEAMAARRA